VPVDRLLALVPALAAELLPMPGRVGSQMLCVDASSASYEIVSWA
jgi:hypothetical protein